MTDDELKKLNRKELLEILIEQSKDIDRLQKAVEDAERRAEDREIRINKAGSIADAAIALNGVLDSAQAAADQYLESVRSTDFDCEKMRSDARAEAARVLASAQTKAARIEAEARANAEKIEAEAKSNAERYWQEVSSKLELFYHEHAGLREYLKNFGKNV